MINLSLYKILRRQGELQQVLDICRRGLYRAEEDGLAEAAVTGWLPGMWGEVLVELKHSVRASDWAQKGVEIAARGGVLVLARVLIAQGRLDGATRLLQQISSGSLSTKARQ